MTTHQTPRFMTDPQARDGLMTDHEHHAVDLAGQLYTHIARHVIGYAATRQTDLAEVAALVHGIQQAVMAQAAARLFPDRYRLLGQSLLDDRQTASDSTRGETDAA